MRASVLCVLVFAASCSAPPKPGKGTPPTNFCPGGAGCEKGNDGKFTVGIAARATSPRSWEQPRADFLKSVGDICPEGSLVGTDGQPHCAELIDDAWKDCGIDTLCPGATGYVAPDADGSQGDGKLDWFVDCGRDRVCPGASGYTGPDADGSEGNGKFDGFWLAGFGNNMPMAGVHDDTFARAVVMTNGDVQIAIVSIDAVGIFNDDIVRIRKRVAEKTMTPPDFILISSTHTHEGPDTMGQWGPRPVFVPERGVDDVWFDKVLIEEAAQAVVDAQTSAREAKVYVAQGHLGARTRETIRDSRDPQVIDDTVTVLKFTEKKSGDPIGSLVNWGNHPEVLSDVNNFASSDFSWAIREAMEKGVYNAAGQLLTPGVGGTCVFLQGKVGGLMTPLGVNTVSVDNDVPKQRSYAKTKAVGDLVAQTALDALGGAQEITAPLLAYGQQPLMFRVENTSFQLVFINFSILKRRLYDFDKMKVISESNYPKVASEISKIQLGPVRFLGVPGELFPELGIGFDSKFAWDRDQVNPMNPNPPDLSMAPGAPYLQEQLGGDFNMVVGLSGDEVGYLVPPYDYKLHPTKPFAEEADGDHYEETNSLGPSTVPTLLDAAKTLLEWEPGL
ncbi:MAG: neutral/alkaline non-lysosomal ceramidase N-terminal domain-containing protein [Archangium sp.]